MRCSAGLRPGWHLERFARLSMSLSLGHFVRHELSHPDSDFR